MARGAIKAVLTADKVYPTLATKKTMADLKGVNIELSPEQFQRVIAVGSGLILQGYTKINVRGWRSKALEDGTFVRSR